MTGPCPGLGPVEPPAECRAVARRLRDLFLALAEQGFTERQALYIVALSARAEGNER